MPDTDKFIVGKVVAAHGLKGELRIYPTTDFTEQRFAPGSRLFLGKEAAGGGEEDLLAVTVTGCRAKPPFLIVSFQGIGDRSEAEKYQKYLVYGLRADAPSLEEEEYWIADLVGCDVVTLEGDKVGVVKEVLKRPANDLYVVAGTGGREILVPATKEVIREVDIKAKLIKIWPLPGLLD